VLTREQTAALRCGARRYCEQSKRPLASLCFVLPLLLCYELGVLLLGEHGIRNGVDTWLRGWLTSVGFEHYFLLPLLTIAALLAWHYTTRACWTFRASVLWWMLLESVVFAGLLFGIACLQAVFVTGQGPLQIADPALLRSEAMVSRAALLVAFCGAGIYEEILFRWMLLPPLFAAAARLTARMRLSRMIAVALSSGLFAMAHYLGPAGDSFDWYSLAFRYFAGIFFAALFLYRGLGVASGAHAFYDVMAAAG